MISAAINRVVYPLDANQLYWLALGAARAGRYSPSSFFFASDDGSRLIAATSDMPRFVSGLTDAIASSAGLNCVFGLQQLLADLTMADVVPAPRYPQVGDTGVSGRVLAVITGGFWANQKDADGNIYQVWVGQVQADIAANRYSTPPANSDIQFTFLFRTTTPLTCGQAVAFDIVQGKYAPAATNLRGR